MSQLTRLALDGHGGHAECTPGEETGQGHRAQVRIHGHGARPGQAHERGHPDRSLQTVAIGESPGPHGQQDGRDREQADDEADHALVIPLAQYP